MATLGNVPAEAYTNTVKDSFSGNGSATAFTMSLPTVTNDVRVVVENVIQDPTVAYSVSGTTLTFTSAPPTGTNNIYVVHLGPAAMTAVPPAEIADATTFASSLTVQGAFTSKGIDDNADAVALTIDSSENVLANTTSTSVIGNGGFAIKPQTGNGTRVDISNDGEAMLLDGAASGPIIGLYGNGTTVGSIGTDAGIIYAGGGDAFLGFDSTYNLIKPASTSTGGGSNGLLDLGGTTRRFKDAYLSGGVYLGGTGSANKLSDVETGSFTPTVTWQSGSPSYSSQGRYTKVGNIVNVRAQIIVNASGGSGVVSIQNLPFTAYTITQTGFGSERGNNGKGLVVWVDSSSTRLNMRYYDYTDVGTTSGDVMVVSAAYQVA